MCGADGALARRPAGQDLHVQHEDVLDDLDGHARMLDYLGLPFEQACLDFHETERAVRTASWRVPTLQRKGVGRMAAV